MKKLFFAFIVLIFCACGSSKKKVTDTGNGKEAPLEQRLADFMKVNDEMDFEKGMDYTYPKLFTLAPREQLVKVMKDAFSSEEVKIELDSMRVDTVFAVFKIGDGSYAKVRYSMNMLMTLKNDKDSAAADDSGVDYVLLSIAEKYGSENVSKDLKTGVIKIRNTSDMVAVKDEYAKEWSFVNLNKEDPMINKLFSKEVLDKLDTYN